MVHDFHNFRFTLSQANQIGLPLRSVYLDMKNIISRTSAIALVVSVAGAGFAQQTFTFAGPIDSAPGAGTLLSGQNPVTTPYAVGATANLISGDLTETSTTTWASEARMTLVNSAFPTLSLLIQPFSSNDFTGVISVTPGSVSSAGSLVNSTVTTGSTWDISFFESYDDGPGDVADGLPDASWSNLSFSTTAYVTPPPSPYIYDNLATPGANYLNQLTFGGGTAGVGDFLTLAGTERTVSRIDAVFYTPTAGGSTRADFTVKLWTGVGPFVSATPLATYVYPDVAITPGALNTYGFGGMSADLGSGATNMGYTITLSDIQGGTAGLGPVIYDPPVIGSSSAIWISDWDGVATGANISAWGFAAPNPNNWGARVWAGSGPKISGAIDLLSTVGSGGTEDITWTLESGANSYTGTVTVADVSSSNYEINIPTGAPNGTYTLKFKGGTFLSDSLEVTLTGASLTGQNVALVNGDIDQDTEVGPGDFEAVVSLFGGPGDADCDNDGEVGPGDFEIVVANFGLGDQ
jgi:hypothetical protein